MRRAERMIARPRINASSPRTSVGQARLGPVLASGTARDATNTVVVAAAVVVVVVRHGSVVVVELPTVVLVELDDAVVVDVDVVLAPHPLTTVVVVVDGARVVDVVEPPGGRVVVVVVIVGARVVVVVVVVVVGSGGAAAGASVNPPGESAASAVTVMRVFQTRSTTEPADEVQATPRLYVPAGMLADVSALNENSTGAGVIKPVLAAGLWLTIEF